MTNGSTATLPNRETRRAAGFVRQRKVYKLVFEDDEMAGLVVRCHSVPLGRFLELAQPEILSFAQGMELTAENLEVIDVLFGIFAESVIEWNLEDEDGPIDCTIDGIKKMDLDFIVVVLKAWMEAVAGVPAPFGQPSPAGQPSLEGSLPMAPLSPSPPS